MRNVVLLINVSLDGFIAGPNGEMDWIASDDEIWDDVLELQSTADTALFGRVNYEGFESYWRASATNPASTKAELEHAQWLNDSTRIVFSKTLEKVEWANTRIIKDNIAEEISRLKQQPGKNLLLFGGASIASTFMQLGLIDEYRLWLQPVVLGSGKPLFKSLDDKLNLKLIKTKTFNSGVVLLDSPYAAD